jgi:hypothetical protein
LQIAARVVLISWYILMGVVIHTCNLSYSGGRQEDGEYKARGVARPCLKNPQKNPKGLTGIVQVVEYFRSMHEALDSIPICGTKIF